MTDPLPPPPQAAKIGVAEQALSASSPDADVNTGDPEQNDVSAAGIGAPAPAGTSAATVTPGVQAVTDLLATAPGGVMTMSSGDCDSCDYWREDSGTIYPHAGALTWLANGAQVWGSDIPSSQPPLEIVRADTWTSMLIDDNEIEAVSSRLLLQTHSELGVTIEGPENDGTDAALWIASGSQKMLLDGNEIDSNGRLYFNHNSHENVIMVANGGNVGIGTTSPDDYKLEVKGTIRAYELILETGWSDYVFEDGYPLMSLGEVEQYINDNGRLPGMPSASEVEEHGVPVGDAQALLLQKVEELTLYVIEQDKRIAELSARVEQCR